MPSGGLYRVILDGRVIEPRLDFFNHTSDGERHPRKAVERKAGAHATWSRVRTSCASVHRAPPASYTPGAGEQATTWVDVISLRKIAFEEMDRRLPRCRRGSRGRPAAACGQRG
ncbi:hypothetical protein HS125_14540 [bacterium]|nr:hypothetical protein [bacterium]